MKLLLTACLLGIYFMACKPAAEIQLPAPVSVDAVKKILTGKSYTTADVGLLSPFSYDTTVAWMSTSEDTSKFFTDYRKERMGYTLKFINDTAFEGIDEGKAINGIYNVDDETVESEFDEDDPETPGIKLRLAVADSAGTDTSFAGMRNLTYTTYVKGITDNQLLLILPREMNRRKVTALMKND